MHMVLGATTGWHNGCRSRRRANKIVVRGCTRLLATLVGHSSFSSGEVQSARNSANCKSRYYGACVRTVSSIRFISGCYY